MKKHSFIVIPVFILLIVICSCSSRTGPWKDDPLAYVLEHGNAAKPLPPEFMEDRDTAAGLIAAAPGTGFLLSEKFAELELKGESEFFLRESLSFERDPHYFILSSLRLIDLLMLQNRIEEAGHEAQVLLNSYFIKPGSALQLHLLDLLCLLSEAKGDPFLLPDSIRLSGGEAESDLDVLNADIEGLIPSKTGGKPGEYALFNSIRSSLDLDMAPEAEQWRFYFTRFLPDIHHSELLGLYRRAFTAPGMKRPGWSSSEAALYTGFALYGDRQYRKAAGVLFAVRDSTKALVENNLVSAFTIDSISKVFAASGRLSQGALFLLELSANSEGDLRDYARFEAARLYRSAGRYWEAGNQFTRLFAGLGEDTDEYFKKRVLWYLLSNTLVLDPEMAADEAVRFASAVSDGSYFRDFYEKLCADLVQSGQFGRIARVLETIEDKSVDDPSFLSIRSHYAYVLARGISAGFYKPDGDTYNPRDLLKTAASGGNVDYYSIMAAALLGDDPSDGFPAPADPDRIKMESDPPGRTGTGLDTFFDRFVSGYFEYGMAEKGLELAARFRDKLSPGVLRIASDNARAAGETTLAMRLEDYADAGDFDGLERLFPKIFIDEITGAALKYNVSVPFLYGLVREESYFQSEVVSYAGAVGLTQLMPLTAEEVAWRMKIESYDLLDPVDNLTMGAFYLDHLRGRFETGAKALLAYNAGATNVRRWEDRYPHLPVDLFLEAVPFPESRIYVRRVLASAAAYGYLYEDLKSEDLVGIFYPGLIQGKEHS